MAGETIIVNETLNVLISIENGYAVHLKPFSGRHQPGVIHARLAKPPIRQQYKTIWHFEQWSRSWVEETEENSIVMAPWKWTKGGNELHAAKQVSVARLIEA